MMMSGSRRLLAAAVLLCASQSIVLADELYWAVRAGSRTGIWAANMDGSNHRLIRRTVSGPRGIAANVDSRLIYYPTNARGIRSAAFGGGNAQTVLETDYGPVGIALEESLGQFYWGEDWLDGNGDLNGRILRADFDGTNASEIVSDVAPLNLALDEVREKVYWTDHLNGNVIMRANLDGTETEELVEAGRARFGLGSRGLGIAVDLANENLYWTTWADGIFRSDLDGANREFIGDVSQGSTTAITVDSKQRFIYFAGNNNLFRASFDGFEFEKLISGVGGVSGLTIVPEPSAIACFCCMLAVATARRR